MNYSKDHNNVRVTLHDETHEGYNGDYDPNDPDDQRLMRFDVERWFNGEWVAVDDAFYCTLIPNTINGTTAGMLLDQIYAEVADAVNQGISIATACERLSWLGE